MTKTLPLLCVFAVAALAQTPAVHPMFNGDDVHEIYLTFAQTDWYEQLTKNYEENEDDVPYISASFVWNDVQYDSVGVRFKGNSSYNGAANSKKKPFRIKLNEFVKGQKIGGMASFSLSNGYNDPSMVRERAYWDIMHAAGKVGPRCSYAALYINGQYWGLYFLGEVVNGDFLENWLGKAESKGNLYKADMGASLEDLGEDKEAYKKVFEKQSNEEADDWTDLIGLVKVLNGSTTEELPAKLEAVMDVDSVLWFLALDNLTVNLDSYVGMGQNYYLYKRPSDSKFMWIPWDPSLAWGGLSQGQTVEGMANLSLEWTNASAQQGGGGRPTFPTPTDPSTPAPTPPTTGPDNPQIPTFPGGPGGMGSGARPLATKLWAIPAYKKRYLEFYHALVFDIVRPDSVLSRMEALRARIRPWILDDSNKLCTAEQFDLAMSTDQQIGGGGGFTPPTRPTDPTTPPTTPTTPPTTPPTNPPTQPGPWIGGGAGGMGTVPGLDAFIRARDAFVLAKLAELEQQ